MKKSFLFSFAVLGMMAMSCQNVGNAGKETTNEGNLPTEASVKEAVEQLMLLDVDEDADEILTAEMFAIQQQALGVHFEGDYFMGFQWNTGVMDACSESIETRIEAVKVLDSLHSDVAMRYVDEGCYDEPYTLHLLNEDGVWKIDDADYLETTLREQCKLFYDEVAEWYRTTSPEDVMDAFMAEEPSEESYTDPNTIYFNNPKAVKKLVSEIRNNLELFKQNSSYTEDLGSQIEEMISRIETHCF